MWDYGLIVALSCWECRRIFSQTLMESEQSATNAAASSQPEPGLMLAFMGLQTAGLVAMAALPLTPDWKWLIAGAGFLLLIASLLLSRKMNSATTAPFAQAQPILLPTGKRDDLEELINVATEVRSYAHKLNRTVTNLEGSLRRMVPSINGANRGMDEIKTELSRTMASVIQVTQGSETHANKAKDVFKAAENAAAGSQVGAQSTEQTINNMDRIREQMDLIAERMDNLLNKSQLMVQVVGFADELALQSKVLSVNAAIEAAKAGDRGEGFSAVAREVKSLANQSKEATRQVRQILKEIQKSIAEVRSSITVGNETVDLASQQCKSTVDSIKGLDESVSSSRDAAEAIMNSSKEQVQGIMQISRAMNDIQTVSEQNSGSLSNLQVEAQKLNTIAKELVAEMNSYQTMLEQLLNKCAALSEPIAATASNAS